MYPIVLYLYLYSYPIPYTYTYPPIDDKTRVLLNEISGVQGSDYVNANYIAVSVVINSY